MRIGVLGLCCLLGGCSLWPGKGPSEPAGAVKDGDGDGAAGAKNRQQKLVEEQELKLAKLWARVDEMEEEQVRQKERLAVVEKGLTLGMVPDELRHPEHAKKPKESAGEGRRGAKAAAKASDKKVPQAKKAGLDDSATGSEHEPVDEPHAARSQEGRGKASAAEGEEKLFGDARQDETHEATVAAPPAATAEGLAPGEAEAYQKALASAQDQFRSGRYGRAVVEYSDIGKRFGEQVGGAAHLYWIAKCWINLKEYNTARQQLSEFLQHHASSPWAPRAKFELGRVEWQLGMQETAVKRFRELIKDHPYEDAAEMAKMELESLDKKL